jgi:hypothetical protein
MTVDMDDDFVVFLIGMRINRPWKVHKWLPVFRSMPRMLRELSKHPELGLLGFRFHPPSMVVQYWRSYEDLEAYARSPDHEHLPAWRDFNRRVKASSGDVGIWHETYRVRRSDYEAVYVSMPPYGLGKVGRLVRVGADTESARDRIGRGSS